MRQNLNDQDTKQNRLSIFRYMLMATMSLEFGLGLQRGIFNNFVVETLGIQPAQLGFVQGIREVPGLLTAPLAAVSGFFKENVYAGLCIIVAALGLFLYVVVSSVPMLILATIVLSIGFHLFYPVRSSIVIKSSLPEERATRMGKLNSGASAAALLAFFLVILITRATSKTNYDLLHGLAAVSALLGGAVVMSRPVSGITKKKYVIDYNPKYTSFYILTFLGGARRHVTMTFAGYLLVEVYKSPVSTMVLLSAMSSLMAIFTRPLIGKLIDMWGEQKSLVFNYSFVTLLFTCYALVKVPWILYVIFILDNGLLGFEVAITTHLGKIAEKEALSAAYAMGSTINHISGISVPIIGGYVWDLVGAPVVFLSGAAISAISLLYSTQLDKREREMKTKSQCGD